VIHWIARPLVTVQNSEFKLIVVHRYRYRYLPKECDASVPLSGMVAKETMSTFEILFLGRDLEVKAGPPMNPSPVPTRNDDAISDPVLVFMLAQLLLLLGL
jgi:hypothetical protein